MGGRWLYVFMSPAHQGKRSYHQLSMVVKVKAVQKWLNGQIVNMLFLRKYITYGLCDQMHWKKKIKVTLVQALRLCTGRVTHRGSRGIALLFQDHGTRRGWEVSVTPRPLFTPGERPGTHCTGGWVGPRAGLDRCGKSRPPAGFVPRTVQPVAQSLYRLSYPAHKTHWKAE
jgi:hypothetical protein